MAKDDLTRYRHALEAMLGVPFSEGNRIDVLRNGDEIFPAMLEAINQAHARIDFLTYVYWTGNIARRFAEALAVKAREGLAVNVLLDSFGASEMSEDLLEQMRSAGVNIEWFRPLARWKFWKIDHRTHRKILVVDGRIGFTGGVGIAEEWEGDARNASEWRDTHFRIRGPAVRGLLGAFLNDWAETGHPIHAAFDAISAPQAQGEAWIQCLRATATVGWSDIATLLHTLIALADQRLRIASAYFVPDDATRSYLRHAVERGVDVEVILPGPHVDMRVSQLASQAEIEPLLKAGIRLWTYQRSMLHTKLILVDGLLACIGSANFNQRSMRKDDEVALVVMNDEAVTTLERHYEEDLRLCEKLKPEHWQQRGLLQRCQEAVVSPFRSEM